MRISNLTNRRSTTIGVALTLGLLAACSDPLSFDFPPPAEPFEATLHDLVDGPIDRPSAFDIVAGRGRGIPRAVRVDQTAAWDFVFAVQDGQPVWLPRGFFEGFEETGGIARLSRAFDEVREAPEQRERYEDREPVLISPGAVYAVRSRPDPSVSLPCRLFAKIEVLSVEIDPTRVRFRFLWNPNCDRRNLVVGEQ